MRGNRVYIRPWGNSMSSRIVYFLKIIVLVSLVANLILPTNISFAGSYVGAKWEKDPLVIKFDLSKVTATKDLSKDEWLNEIRGAFNIWNNGASENNVPLELVEDSNSPDVKVVIAGNNFRDISKAYYWQCLDPLCFLHDPLLTQIDRAEIVVYQSKKGVALSYKPHLTPESTQNLDPQSIVLHEIGHVLGLDHSTDCSAVMFGDECVDTVYKGYYGNFVKRNLSLDDISTLQGVYGTSGNLPPIQIPKTNSKFDNTTLIFEDIPPETVVLPNQNITKTWRMRNTGTTTWSSGYQLAFIRGDQMGAPVAVDVPSTTPGQEVDISVNLIAPTSTGSFTGYWRMRNPQGTYFGPEIWVKIKTQATGSHITVLSVDPPSPSDTSVARVYARVENFPNFRAMRINVDGRTICELGAQEIYCDWNTAGYNVGAHSITVEVADQTDSSWSKAEVRSLMYTLTGSSGSSNRVPDRPSLVANPVYDWYVYYSGNIAHLCAEDRGDPDGDPITGYYFEVTGAENWNSGWVGSSCVTTQGMGPHNYAFRAKVRDSNGGESEWSDSWHYTLVNPTLSITQFDFQPLDVNSEQVRIRACTAGQGGIGITMKVSVNEANDGSGNGQWNTIYELGVPCFNETDAPTWHTLKYGDGTHRVRVEAHGMNSGWDGATVLEKTFTLPHRRPAGPELYAPVPASKDYREAVFLNRQELTFKWENTLRNNGYTLIAGVNPNPQSDPYPLLKQTVGTNVTEYTASFSQEYPALYWQVVAHGDAGSSPSNDQKFGIDRTAPTCNVQYLAPIVFDNAFKVTWQGTDDVAGITKYDIQVKDSSRGEWVDWQANQPASKTFDIFIGQPGHSYSFRCRSIDNAGNLGVYPSNSDTETKIDPLSRPPEPWWNSAYSFKRSLVILNNDNDWMPKHFPVRIHFDGSTNPTAAQLYDASVSAIKGDDIRIVYQNQIELNRVVQRFSKSQVDIWIPLQSGLGSGVEDSTNYQLYYRNPNANTPPADISAVFLPEADANTVGLWHFQEGGGATSFDSSGRNHNGTYSNVGWIDGPTGWAASFNGWNSSVTIPHSNDFSSNAMTIEAWVYVTVFNGVWHPLVNKRIPYNPGGFEFRFSNDREIILINDITTGNWDVRSSTLEAGRWYHVAGTFNGSNRSCIYVNGNLVRCRDLIPGSPKFTTGPITIGFSHEGSGDKSLPGYVQHVRLSNIVRTDFPYARIDAQPSVAVGIQQTPTVADKPDLAIVSLNSYPVLNGDILVEAVVKNQGVVSSGNGFFTDLYLNHLPAGSGDFTGSLSFWVNDPISAGSIVTLTTVVSQSPGTMSLASSPASEARALLYAQIDSTGSVIERDDTNNIFAEGLEICTATPDAFEGDDTATTASQGMLWHAQLHNFTSQRDQDWIKFEAQEGDNYIFNTSGLGQSSDTYLYLYDQDGLTLLASNDDYGSSLASQIKWTAPDSGTYYVLVRHWNPNVSGCGTTYSFSVQQEGGRLYLPLLRR